MGENIEERIILIDIPRQMRDGRDDENNTTDHVGSALIKHPSKFMLHAYINK